MACNAQGHGTIKVVELTTPSLSERRMPALHAWDLPKSSALMINKRALSEYPNKRLVWLPGKWVIILVASHILRQGEQLCSGSSYRNCLANGFHGRGIVWFSHLISHVFGVDDPV